MTRLTSLRLQLVRLKRRRWQTRTAAAYSALLSAVLLGLAAILTCDWLLDMSRLQRAVAQAIVAGLLVWAFWRFTRPWLGHREDELDIALLLEREQRLDSDLVAALQFESPAAPLWGSVELEQAVIEHAAELAPRLGVQRAVPRGKLLGRMSLAAAAVAVWIAVCMLFPDHAWVFLNRLLLGTAHYPSRTQILDIAVNGCRVDPLRPALYTIKVPAGGGVQFAVTCQGKLPDRGEVRLATARGVHSTLDLQPEGQRWGEYRGELGPLVESVDYQLFLGDAWTDPAPLEVVALPVADLELEVTPPSYVGTQAAGGKIPPGLRQVSVIEGSRVVVHVVSEKRLREATLTASGHKYGLRDESAGASSPDRWVLDAPDTPLAAVVESLPFSIQVTDRDDLQFEQPIQGTIRIQPDLRPQIAAGIVTPQVLPGAVPVVYWRGRDDFGLARVSALRQVTHADGQSSETEVEIYKYTSENALQKDLESQYALNLEPLKLVKGDVVTITLRAVDYRGPREGQSSSSEPLVLHVTDLQGVLAMVTEPDRKSVEQLKTMIDRQLGIGGAK